MSTTPPRGAGERATPERRGAQVGFGPRGMMGGGADREIARTSGAPRVRLLRELAPDHVRVVVILVLGVSERRTLGARPPPPRRRDQPDLRRGDRPGDPGRGQPVAQAVAQLRQSGQGTLANLVQSTPITHGVDFDHLGQILLQRTPRLPRPPP